MIHHKLSLLISLSLLSVASAFAKKPTTTDNSPTRPNFLLLDGDDQQNHTLGCAGHPIEKTPNIDRLAKHGVRFENALDESDFGRDPNVIIILADDLGYGDCEPFNSSSKIKTPYLSKLAEEGLCFTDAHSASATCTPSRYGLLTGISPVRTGVRNTLLSEGKPIIEKQEQTLADLFQKKGYHTHMVGKWHLGFDWDRKWTNQPLRGGPVDRGFDTFFGIHSSAGGEPLCFLEQDRLVGRPTEDINFPKYNSKGEKVINHAKAASGFTIEGTSEAFIQRTVHLLKEHSTNKNQKPFFLYYASPIPHQPWVPMKKFRGKSGLGDYGDFVMQLDWVVGEINQALKKYDLDQNTLLIFTSDNGAGPPAHKVMSDQGHASSEIYRGMKASGYEGGHRVPFIAKWPRKLQAGSTSLSTINFVDFFATLSEILGIDHRKEFPSAVDSQSFLSALMSPKKKFSRQPMIHRSNTMRIEKWKWIHPSRSILFSKANPNEFEVYNLEKDPGEQIKLAPKKPKLRQKFFQTYQKFNQEIKLK